MQSVADPGEEPGGPAPLFLDQTFFGDCPPSISQGPSLSKAQGPPLSQGLDPALEIRKACFLSNL